MGNRLDQVGLYVPVVKLGRRAAILCMARVPLWVNTLLGKYFFWFELREPSFMSRGWIGALPAFLAWY